MLLRPALDARVSACKHIEPVPAITANPSFRSTQLPDLYTVITHKYHKQGIAATWIRATLKI